ncbi:lipocalin-like domain-containing protein [Massilia sp. ST3]|uniref:lipocalin-like domain-containing protein n=1 Tax=Massilia sp. ST3 TaxID=2824903 RepID=UPI001B82830F|nr:lipocalin-like domain-containing protein [Massilia sp. ST3]
MNKQIAGMVLASVVPAAHASLPALAGTWTLVAADVQRPDGRIERDYGAAPKGRLSIDPQGRYTLQIFKAERPRFASADKAAATNDEFRAAVLGSSTHFGTIALHEGQLVFQIEAASFPNWEGTVQRRSFELQGDELRYRVPARPDGGIPISIWRRMP